MWQEMKRIQLEAAEVSIGFKKHAKKRSWITGKTNDLINRKGRLNKKTTLYRDNLKQR